MKALSASCSLEVDSRFLARDPYRSYLTCKSACSLEIEWESHLGLRAKLRVWGGRAGVSMVSSYKFTSSEYLQESVLEFFFHRHDKYLRKWFGSDLIFIF